MSGAHPENPTAVVDEALEALDQALVTPREDKQELEVAGRRVNLQDVVSK
jgi:hypothetical protein